MCHETLHIVYLLLLPRVVRQKIDFLGHRYHLRLLGGEPKATDLDTRQHLEFI